jgi:hypothetical protein
MVLNRLKDATNTVTNPLLKKLYLEMVYLSHAAKHGEISSNAADSAVGAADAPQCKMEALARNDEQLDTQIISAWSFKVRTNCRTGLLESITR